MDDGQFFLGQCKRNRFLLGGVQGGVVEGRRPCGRGGRVRPALWALLAQEGAGLPGRHPINTKSTCFVFKRFPWNREQQTADQAKPSLPPASLSQALLGPSHTITPACSCPSPQSPTLIIRPFTEKPHHSCSRITDF